MNTKYVAIIRWISPGNGGRITLPYSGYSAPAKFDGHEELWSLVVTLYPQDPRQGTDPRIHWADVWFLADKAPNDWLKPGAKFTLYEGTQPVAHGECMHQFVQIP